MPKLRLTATRALLVALGLLATATLACAAVVGPLVVRLSASGPRVVAAVKAGYPELCSEWRDKLVAVPSPASWYTNWDVDCITGNSGSEYGVMTVNVVTCEWREPVALSLDWHKLLGAMAAPSQPLRRCP